jgi:hypothetical protein
MQVGISLGITGNRRAGGLSAYNLWVAWNGWPEDAAWNDYVATDAQWNDNVPTQSQWLYPEGRGSAFTVWDDDVAIPISYRIAEIERTGAGQAVFAFAGDSWVHGPYWTEQFAKAMQDNYGNAGIGYVGFQYFGTSTGTWVDGGLQPSGGGAGAARTDLVSPPVFSGLWTSDNGGQPGGTASPSIGWAETSAASAYVRFTVPAGHNAADLIFVGTAAGGTVEYSWNGGSSWETAIDISGTDGVVQTVALANVPATAATLRLRRASGTIRMAGVNLKSAASGVIVHKLGASGSNSNQWTAVDLADWAEEVSLLGTDFFGVLLGTNDQPGNLTPFRTSANLSAIMAAVQAENASIERLCIMPAETIRVTPSIWPMTEYTAAVNVLAKVNGFAVLDLQGPFGPDPAAYAFGQPGALMDNTNGHPAAATGGLIISNSIRALTEPA